MQISGTALAGRHIFLPLANPARRKIETADFPLGWAGTLRRFAATVGMIYQNHHPVNR
ncbi:MAG: hypothetical protein LBP75_01020 [Planctomycetota bacterium]|jgi:hypothetical protein|nr:hypothetical protein [Planctomycetota bacterium]